MNEFNFGHIIKIRGKEYRLDIGRREIHEKLLDLIPEIKKSKGAEQSIARAKELIDLVLGTGAYDEIFEGRYVNKGDLIALLDFVLAEAKEAYK